MLFRVQTEPDNVNLIVGVPLITAVTFVITFGLVLAMKKVPILKRLIG